MESTYHMNEYSILVNTCDKFEDCWNPFFKLWSIYWPDCRGQIFLNTEYKDYRFESLKITPLKVCKSHNIPHNKRATWSQCLKWALESIDSDIVLYMQEDYFLKDFVKEDIVNKYVQLMIDNKDIDCIHLTDQAVKPETTPSEFDKLFPVKLNQRYRISCQAALWKRDVLLSYLRSYENAWQFEEYGSKRGKILKHNFYVVDKNWIKLNEFEIIPYIFTGIVQGRWLPEVVPLFEKHQILIDYSTRGFSNQSPKKSIFRKIKTRIQKIPVSLRSSIDLILLPNKLL